MTVTAINKNCLRCGAPLSTGAIEGFCQRCLAVVAFGEADETVGNAASDSFSRRLGNYELFAEIGRGGMGVVYRARQIGLERDVAVKVLRQGPLATPEETARFRREAAAAAGLHHANIVAIHEVGEADGHWFFSMELVEGQTLAELTRDGPLDSERAARYALGVANAVGAAHEQNVLHRDLKPANVIIDTKDQPRVTDFGLAKRLDAPDATSTRQVMGSPGYMPPEQADPQRGSLSFASDVYSLGALLYHLLTGRPPFAAATVTATIAQVLHNEPVPPRRLNSSVPRDLETICLKCLHKESARRYDSAKNLAADLLAFLERRPIAARPASAMERLALVCRRKPAQAALSAGLFLALLLGIAGVSWQARLARREAATARLNAYAADMGAASLAAQQGDIGRARALLAAHRPAGGEEDLRGFEWRLLWERSRGQELAVLGMHSNIVTSVAFSPDGRTLASAGRDQIVTLWDVASRKRLVDLQGHQGAVWSVAFSPDGKTLLTGGDDGAVKLWNLATRQVTATFSGIAAIFAAGGARIVTTQSRPVYWDNPGRIEVWDATSARRILEMPIQGKAVAVSPDGRKFAVTLGKSGVELRDFITGEFIKRLDSDDAVCSPVFSPSGRQLAGVSGEKVLVWEIDSASSPRVLAAHHLRVWSASFSPDGKMLVTTGSDRSVRLWDMKNWSSRAVLWGHTDEVWCAAMSPDGASLVSGGKDGSVRMWSPQPKEPKPILHTAWQRPIFSPDGKRVVTAPGKSHSFDAVVWDAATREPLLTVSNAVPVGFAPDGQQIVVWRQHEWALEFWRESGTQPVRRITLGVGQNSRPLELGLSPNGAFCLAAGSNAVACVFETLTGRKLHELRGPKPGWRSFALSNDGRRAVVSREEDTFGSLLDFAAQRVLELRGHRDTVSGTNISRDGTRVATGGADARIKIWDAATGKLLRELTGHLQDATDVSFSPDGRTLASVGYQDCVKLWNLATGREVASFEMPRASSQIQFSLDGRHLGVTLGGIWSEAIEILSAPSLVEIDAVAH